MQGCRAFSRWAKNRNIAQPYRCCANGIRWAAHDKARAGVEEASIPGSAFCGLQGLKSWCPAGSRCFASDRNVDRGAFATEGSLPEDLRRLLRHLVSSVVVCTAQPYTPTGAIVRSDAHPQSTVPATPAAPVGLTMSSFTSLSLQPSPVVSFNISMPSRTGAAIAQSRHFAIHVLSGDARGARVADIFRSGNAHPDATSDELSRSGCGFVWKLHLADQKHQADHGRHQPFLRGPGILYVLRCRLLDEPLNGLVPVRDHVVVLGEVLEILSGKETASNSADEPVFGLVYGGRHYRQLSGAVVKAEPRR